MATSDEIGALRTEVRYLKWIIPSACGFVALLVCIFWGVERSNIGRRVSQALDDAGVQEAVRAVREARQRAELDASYIADLKSALPWASVQVLSVDHVSGTTGRYFNFDADAVTRIARSDRWNSRPFLIINARTSEIGPAVLWSRTNGGSAGSGHGRWSTRAANGQWRADDRFIIVSVPLDPDPE